MMINPSQLLLLGAAIVGHIHAATSHQRKSDIPDLIWSDGKSADEEIACKEQSMSTILEKQKRENKTLWVASSILQFVKSIL
jgi:hypothetical protein